MTKPRMLAMLVMLVMVPLGPARAIEDGFEAEPCVFPEVVRIFAGYGPIAVLDGPTINCTGVYIGGHTILTAAACVDAAPAPHEVHWGEAFSGEPMSASTRLRMAIPVDDCRIHPVLPVAACTLREMPTMQSIPLIAPCEVDEVLTPGAELFAVGVHQGKQWAVAELPAAIPSNSVDFQLPDTIWTTANELSSQVLQPDDLGGPLYARAPDGSLRMAGIVLETESGRWLASWQLIDWLLEFEDPEVVLPCHSPAGGWAPAAACTQLIADRTLGEGAWGRGPAVCSTAQSITPTPTCQ